MIGSPGTTYTQNRGLDVNNDGVVTKQEAAAKVASVYHTLQCTCITGREHVSSQYLRIRGVCKCVADSGHLIGGSGAPINAAGTTPPAPAGQQPGKPAASSKPAAKPAAASPAADPRDAPCRKLHHDQLFLLAGLS